MQVHKMIVAQENAARSTANASTPYNPYYPQLANPQLANMAANNPPDQSKAASALYPGLGDFMGLELSQDVIALNMPEYVPSSQAVSDTIAYAIWIIEFFSAFFFFEIQ